MSQVGLLGNCRMKYSIAILISIIFPDLGILGSELRYGIVVRPTLDVKKEPKFRSERVSQLIYGEVFKVENIEKEYASGNSLKDDYQGYVDVRGLILVDKKVGERYYNQCISKEGLVVTERFTPILAKPTSTAKMVFYVPFGARFVVDTVIKDFWRVVLPDKKYGYIPLKFAKKGKNIKENVVELAEEWLYTPYLWGGTSTFGTDCSGFISRLYFAKGIIIPRDSYQQEKIVKEVHDLEKLPAGGLIFFPGHVGLYDGNGMIIHANGHSGCVSKNYILKPRTDYEKELKQEIGKMGVLP